MSATRLRSHTCGELRSSNLGQTVTLMGWVARIRNFGQLVFIDLRDHFGITQIVITPERSFREQATQLRVESVIRIVGVVQKREGGANPQLQTGEIEVLAEMFELESHSEILPFPVTDNLKAEGEESRLRYRYLDLRTEKMQRNIKMRSEVIAYIRQAMMKAGFQEFQTPILTSSSPEGARDFLVPSRLHPGHFYALPQAPQQFKQIIMCSGFDRYFQIAPCFRDEDPRADRSPGDFYQLDIEMSYVTQDDILETVEGVISDVFSHFSNWPYLTTPFPRITYREALLRYGSDKPDLRFKFEMMDVSFIFKDTSFKVFQGILSSSGHLRAIKAPGLASSSRKNFDEWDSLAKSSGLGGLPYLCLSGGEWKGSAAKFVSEEERKQLCDLLEVQDGDAIVFIAGPMNEKTLKAGGKIRQALASAAGLGKEKIWAFCWIVDYPFYEWNEDEQKIDFSHNPFSMPQGGMQALQTKEPLEVLAYQYDLVCNGIELSSGAIRNHRRDIMEKAFAIAGYGKDVVERKFPALWNAFRFGAPPHGGIAPGIDRMLMLLLDEPNIREVIMFPLSQKAQDLMMGAPSDVSQKQLSELNLMIKPAPTKEPGF